VHDVRLRKLVERRLEQHYNATARPFDRKFTRTGLNSSKPASAATTRSRHSRRQHEPDELTAASTS
jgi:hypothetical protein